VCNPNSQKNVFTNLCTHLPKEGELRGSPQFATAAKIQSGDVVEISFNDQSVEKEFRLDETLKGTIALMPIFDLGFAGQQIGAQYRFNKAKIKQVNK